MSSSPQEKMYVTLDGTIHVSNGENEVVLGKPDFCRIAGGENRRLTNKTDSPVMVPRLMPLSASKCQQAL